MNDLHNTLFLSGVLGLAGLLGLVEHARVSHQENDPRKTSSDPWVRSLPDAEELSAGSLVPRYPDGAGRTSDGEELTGVGSAAEGTIDASEVEKAPGGKTRELPDPIPLTTHAEAEPNDAFGEAQRVGASSRTTATISPRGDTDWYRFDAPRRGSLEVRFTRVPPGVAPAFLLHDREGRRVGSWIYPVQDGKSETTVLDLSEAGPWYLSVADDHHDAESTSPYELALTFHAGDGYEPNEVLSEAALVAPNRTLQATILPLGDLDRYAVLAARRGSLEVEFTSVPASIQPAILLVDPEGRRVGSWVYLEAVGGRAPTHVLDLPRAGRWDLVVADAKSDARSWDPYALRLDLLLGDAHEPNETPGRATPLARGTPVQGTILPLDDQDWYAVDVATPGTITIEVPRAPAGVNLAVKVVDPDMSRLKNWTSLERRGAGYAPLEVEVKRAGRYSIGLADAKDANRSTEPYELVVR